MWRIIYNVFTLALFPIFALYSMTQGKIRRNFRERLLGRPKAGDLDGALWVHGASIGEVVIAQNLLKYLRENTPLKRYVLTTNTHYARDLAASRLGDVPVYALPFDLAFSVSRFLGDARPLALVIVETEIWPNLIWQAKRRGIPVLIVNGRISDSTFKTYRRFSFFFKHVLSGIDLILAQSQEHASRFIKLSPAPGNVLATGNIKYYRNMAGSGDPIGGRRAVTFGSVREKEFDAILMVLARLAGEFPDYTFYVAPREIHLASSLADRLSNQFSVTTFSRIQQASVPPPRVVVVDTVGDLMDIYGKSSVAFVGGSLAPQGGQNILEPLFFGTPVLFGPHVENFQEIAVEILEEGAGIQVQDEAELLTRLRELLSDLPKREAMGRAGMKLIAKQQEAMASTAKALLERLSSGQRTSPRGRRE